MHSVPENPINPMWLHHYIETSAARDPHKIAVIHDGNRVSYRQLSDGVNRLAECLREHGVSQGERVALLLENSVDYVIAYFAALKAGAVAAPLNPDLRPNGLQYLLNDLEPAALIGSAKSERLLKAVSLDTPGFKLLVIRNPQKKWNDLPYTFLTFSEALTNPTTAIRLAIPENALASIVYTSGSTGHPKGVMLSHFNLSSNAHSICSYLSLTQNDIQMVVLPFFYVMGQSLLNTHMAVGGTVVINNRFMYPADAVHQMIEEQVTGFSGVPSTYAYLLKRSPLAGCRDQLESLRYCSQAGGHMASSIKRALRKALPDHTQIFIMYGATEASARLTYLDPAYFSSKIDAIGKPIPGVTIRILDDQGRELPDGAEGELVANGSNIMNGYWKDPQYTATVLDAQGYHTGDIGYRDKEGFLYILGRKDGLLKVGGHRINPVEIEDFLMSTEQIIEAAVIGIPDPLFGNKLLALVVPQDGAFESKSLMGKCSENLPAHKWPAIIIPVRALPKNASGKIDREKCVCDYGPQNSAIRR